VIAVSSVSLKEEAADVERGLRLDGGVDVAANRNPSHVGFG
jgi:hypothetical protein